MDDIVELINLYKNTGGFSSFHEPTIFLWTYYAVIKYDSRVGDEEEFKEFVKETFGFKNLYIDTHKTYLRMYPFVKTYVVMKRMIDEREGIKKEAMINQGLLEMADRINKLENSKSE